MELLKAFILIILILLPMPVLAEDVEKDTHRFGEVVVTATRTERSTEEVPAAVSVVTKEDIDKTKMLNIKEALTDIPGVQAESRSGGYDARLIIRGAGLKARYGVREIMVLLDGVPITDPDGLTRLDFVDTQLVEKVEVVKGPNSTLYGANAAGGVINVITRSPFEEAKSVRVGYGSDNTQLYNLTYGKRLSDTYFTFSGSRRSTDSWREWNEFSTDQFTVKLGQLLQDGTLIEGTASYTKADIQLPGTLTKEQLEDDITQRTSEIFRNSGRYSNVFSANLRMEKPFGQIKLKPILYVQYWDHYHPVTPMINDGNAAVFGTDIQADYSHTIAGMQGTLTAGVTGQIDQAEGDKFTYKDVRTSAGKVLYTLSDNKGELAETGDDTTTKWGIFVQESLRPSDLWIVDIGVRFDQVGFDIDTEEFKEFNFALKRYVDKRESISRDETFQQASPRIGATYKLSKVLTLYGNISTGFQTPQSSELNLNPDLDPMTVYNYETGLKGRFEGGHSFDLSLYYITVDDEVVQTVEQGNQSTYSNAGKTTKKGVEFTGKVQTLEGLFTGVSYAYSDYKFDDFKEPVRQGPSTVLVERSDNRLPYIPVHQYSLFMTYAHKSGFRAKIDTTSWGEYYIDNANSEKYGGYDFLTSIFVGYQVKNFDFAFDISNVFDKTYAMEVTKEVGGNALYRPGAPRSYFGRVTYTF